MKETQKCSTHTKYRAPRSAFLTYESLIVLVGIILRQAGVTPTIPSSLFPWEPYHPASPITRTNRLSAISFFLFPSHQSHQRSEKEWTQVTFRFAFHINFWLVRNIRSHLSRHHQRATLSFCHHAKLGWMIEWHEYNDHIFAVNAVLKGTALTHSIICDEAVNTKAEWIIYRGLISILRKVYLCSRNSIITHYS